MKEFGKVAVMLGGESAERDISMQTGEAVYAALCRKGVEAYKFDPKHDGICKLLDEKYDCVFIALHGRGGEDGRLQGALEYLGIPYTGSGVLGSALAMDKVRSKSIWMAHGLKTGSYIEIHHQRDLDRVVAELGMPVMIKPVQEGSSCGAAKVNDESELMPAWLNAKKYDKRVMAERWITGKEYTVAILHNKTLPMIRLETPREFYDYEAKYLTGTTKYICPCGLSKEKEKEIAKEALTAFNLVGATGWGRVDIIVDGDGDGWLIEVNTVPGMTDHSLVPMSAKEYGIEFDDLVIEILNTCFTDERLDKRTGQ